MNRLYWVRHGENLANITKEFSYKKLNYPLTPKGELQAKQTSEYFKDRDIHEIYSSPTKRAIETAEIIAAPHNLKVVFIENFLEVNVGKLDGQKMSAEIFSIHNRIIDDWFASRHETGFPDGEDYLTLWERMRRGLENILAHKDGRNIIVVGHGGSFKYTLKDLCRNINPIQLRNINIHNCSITEIIIHQRDGQLEGELVNLAYDDHLHGAAADLVSGLPNADNFMNGGELDATR